MGGFLKEFSLELETENIQLKSAEAKNTHPDQEGDGTGDKNKEELVSFALVGEMRLTPSRLLSWRRIWRALKENWPNYKMYKN